MHSMFQQYVHASFYAQCDSRHSLFCVCCDVSCQQCYDKLQYKRDQQSLCQQTLLQIMFSLSDLPLPTVIRGEVIFVGARNQ